MTTLNDSYVSGEIDHCYLCWDDCAVTSDGVCMSCAEMYPLSKCPSKFAWGPHAWDWWEAVGVIETMKRYCYEGDDHVGYALACGFGL